MTRLAAHFFQGAKKPSPNERKFDFLANFTLETPSLLLETQGKPVSLLPMKLTYTGEKIRATLIRKFFVNAFFSIIFLSVTKAQMHKKLL